MENFIDNFVRMPLSLLLNGTKVTYETIYSVPLSILRENVYLISISLYLIWYIKAYLSRTELIVKDGSIMQRITEKITSIHSGYKPTMWCFPAHFNTVTLAVFQKCVPVNYKREILKTQDGGLLAIDWNNLEDSKNKLILLILPGLTGCSKDNYVTHFVDKAKKNGCKAIVMNYRGIEVELTTPRTYCATNYEDLHLVVNHVHNRYKDHKIMAVGVSLGGIKLGGYLAKHSNDVHISYAMIVSAPFNIFYSAEEMELSRNFYTFNKHCARRLGAYFNRNRSLFENDEKFDCMAISKSSCIRDFDTLFVTKQFGYKSCEDYYRDACLDAKIQDINVPTLFLNAGDDMFSPEKVFPIEKIKANPNTALVWTKYGGHISFCEGLIPNGCNYGCRILTEYIQQVLIEEGL